jgi:hypothetical protein
MRLSDLNSRLTCLPGSEKNIATRLQRLAGNLVSNH